MPELKDILKSLALATSTPNTATDTVLTYNASVDDLRRVVIDDLGMSGGGGGILDVPVNNVVGGEGAFTGNVSGFDNVVFGKDALYTDTDSRESVAIGLGAGRNTSNFRWSVAIGFEAARNNYDLSEDTYIGWQAGYGPSTGVNPLGGGGSSVGVGAFALWTTDEGWGNTAIGAYAGQNLENGSANTFVGVNSGWDVINGENNIFIGNESALTGTYDGIGNIFIGAYAGTDLVDPDPSHMLLISGYVTDDPDMAFSEKWSLVYGRFDDKFLRINGKLQVENPVGATGNAFEIRNSSGTVVYSIAVDGTPSTGGGGGGSVAWGAITGTLTSQADLDTALTGKQATLVSGTNIKTINSTSLLGSGNIAVQDVLVSGTNIKTINGASILGSGDIVVSGGTSYTNEEAQDAVGGMVDSTLTYVDATPTLGVATNGITSTQLADNSVITTKIADANITLAKLANIANNTILGNNTGGVAAPVALTASQARSVLGLSIGSTVQAYDADLDIWATLTPSANAQSLVTAANYAAMRTLLSLTVGTDVQAYDADLATIAGLTATTDNFIQSKSGAWASRTVAQVSADLQGTGLLTDAVGFRTVPQNSQSTAYTAVAADSGKHILHPSADTTARIYTIPSNASVAYPVGTAITIVNQDSAGVITISITSDTMRLAGAGTTGSRTLAANGIATALKITSTEWIISGTGLT